MGIAVGIAVTLVVHLYRARQNPLHFLAQTFSPGTTLKEDENGAYLVDVRGVANFLSILGLDKRLSSIPNGKDVIINLAESKLIDVTVMETLVDFQRLHGNTGGTVKIVGLENHESSGHAQSIHVLRKAESTR